MSLENLKMFVQNLEKIESVTLELVPIKEEDKNHFILYKCLENQKYYFSYVGTESMLHAEASSELVEELKK